MNIKLEDDKLDASHGPTRLLLLAEHWKREALKARAAIADADAVRDANTFYFKDADIWNIFQAMEKVRLDGIVRPKLIEAGRRAIRAAIQAAGKGAAK